LQFTEVGNIANRTAENDPFNVYSYENLLSPIYYHWERPVAGNIAVSLRPRNRNEDMTTCMVPI